MRMAGVVGWWLAFFGLAAFRAYMVVGLCLSGHVIGWLMLLPESLALILGVMNAVKARVYDYRVRGLVVPVAYSLGIVLLSGVELLTYDVPALALWLLAVAVSAWALVCLGVRFTVAGSSYVSLCDRGPYRWIRHPQALARVLFVSAVCLPALEVGRWFFLIFLVGVVVAIEEELLVTRPEYREYAARVRWRLLPGVV